MKRAYIKKLLKSGKSAVVVIPKWWLDFHCLKHGDEVRLEITSGQIVVKAIKGGKVEAKVKE